MPQKFWIVRQIKTDVTHHAGVVHLSMAPALCEFRWLNQATKYLRRSAALEIRVAAGTFGLPIPLVRYSTLVSSIGGHDGHRAFFRPRHFALRHDDWRHWAHAHACGVGLATTYRTRSDIEHQWLPARFSVDPINRQLGTGDAELNEWKLLQNQFHALVRKGFDGSEVIFDAQFGHRLSRVIEQAARANWRRWDDREQHFSAGGAKS